MMSTRDRDRIEKLAAGRKKLRKFQSRQKALPDPPLLLAPPAPETNALLQGVGGVPELTTPLASLSLNSLSLTTPTDLPIPVSNGYITGGGWSLAARPLTPCPLSVNASQCSLASEGDRQQLVSEVGREVGSGLPQDVQAQTIGILVAEKSSLQSEVESLCTDLRNKKREVEDLASHLQSTRQQLEQNERLTLSLSQEKILLERNLLGEGRAREEMELSLQEMKTALEDTRQENTELVSKVTSQAAELHSLQEMNSDLRSRLTMAELLTQQLSPSSPDGQPESLADQLEELRGEVEKLEAVVRSVSGERDQALGDLDALREAMIQNRQESAERLSELHSRLAESEAERVGLAEELSELSQRQYELAQHASFEHAQEQQSTQVAMETLRAEKEELQTQLQSQLAECERQCELVQQLESRVEEAEGEAERLQETSVSSQALMDTLSRDKEALSRAVAQNRELKAQLEELQDGFIRLSQQNMELASELETERFKVSRLQTQLQEREETGRGDDDRIVGGESHEELRAGVEAGTQTTGEEEQRETGHLSGKLQVVEMERESLRQQLEEVARERDDLHGEVAQLHSQLKDTTPQPITANERGSPMDTDTANQTMEILSSLQGNFNALQERYVAVMSEKAELLEQVEQRELTIGQLSGETETIGEYITLYQAQREALREKFKEKDNFIQQLISEKEAVQAQLSEVQRLMRQLVTDRPSSRQLTPSPPPSSPSSLPLHLQQLSHSHHHTPPSPPLPPPPPNTVDQIFQLLSKMGETRERSGAVPCSCCTGDIIVV